jgi:LPXTG-motif cell wall-anchored protein
MSKFESVSRRWREGGVAAGLLVGLLSLPAAVAQAAPGDGARPGGPATVTTRDASYPPPDHDYAMTGVTASPARTDYDHRKVTVTGRLMKHNRATGVDLPAPGQTVDVVVWGIASSTDATPGDGTYNVIIKLGTVTTDAQGRFRLANVEVKDRYIYDQYASAGPWTEPIMALRRLDSHTYGDWGAYQEFDVKALTQPSRIVPTYTIGPLTSKGHKVTVDFLYERKSATGWKPVKGLTATISWNQGGGGDRTVGEATTGANGHASVSFMITGGGQVTLYSSNWTDDAYLDCDIALTDDRLYHHINLAHPDPTPSGTATPTPAGPGSGTATPTPTGSGSVGSTAGADTGTSTSGSGTAPSDTSTANNPGALASTGSSSHTTMMLMGGVALAAAGATLVAVTRRRALRGRRH